PSQPPADDSRHPVDDAHGRRRPRRSGNAGWRPRRRRAAGWRRIRLRSERDRGRGWRGRVSTRAGDRRHRAHDARARPPHARGDGAYLAHRTTAELAEKGFRYNIPHLVTRPLLIIFLTIFVNLVGFGIIIPL